MIDDNDLETSAQGGFERGSPAMRKGSLAGRRKLITIPSSSGVPRQTSAVVRMSAEPVKVPGCACPAPPTPPFFFPFSPSPFLAKTTADECKCSRGIKLGLLVHAPALQLIVYVQMQRRSLCFCLQIANNFNLRGLA